MEKIRQFTLQFFIKAISLYQYTISPLLGMHCRYNPSCSEYMKEAIQYFGLVRGMKIGLTRLLRCQPLCKGGYDPLFKEKK